MRALVGSMSAILCLALVAGCASDPTPQSGATLASTSSSPGSMSCPAGGSASASNDNEMMGTLLGIGLGAVGGGMMGRAAGGMAGTMVGVAAGAAVGGLIGNRIGATLDEQSKRCHEAAIRRVVSNPAVGATSWRIDEQKSSGAVTPLRSFNQNGKQCTTVQQVVTKNGKTISDTNSYCKESDGSLTLLN